MTAPRRARRALRLAAALACLQALAACGSGDLQFRNDDRLSFSTPGERDRVSVPVSVAWTMSDFDAVGLDGSADSGKGTFAVFVDRSPMPAGKDLDWLARDDSSCRSDPRCPSAAYLAERDVYLTRKPALLLDRLPDAGNGVGDVQHSVTVVVLDGTGTRIGESAWYLPFRTKRTST